MADIEDDGFDPDGLIGRDDDDDSFGLDDDTIDDDDYGVEWWQDDEDYPYGRERGKQR